MRTEGFWRLADPKITLASMASLFLGLSIAASDGPIAWGWLAATVAGIFCVEVAKNASGEIFDFDSGADQAVAPEDRSPFSGGKRVMVDGLLTRRETALIALAFYATATAIGLLIAWRREPTAAWLGVAGLCLAYFYHAPPIKLSYRGLGEVAVALCYGPLIGAGAYLVQRHGAFWRPALPLLPLGVLIGAFLWINEFPDYAADKASGKNTLVVRLGRPRAAAFYAGLMALAAAGTAVLPLLGYPRGVLLGLAFLPAGIDAARRLLADPERTASVIPAQTRSLLAFLLYALGAGIGFLLT